MKASTVLALAGAALVAAGPIDKRYIATEYVTDVVFVTVTVDPAAATSTVAPTTTKTPIRHQHKTSKTTITYTPTTSSTSTPTTSTSTTPTTTSTTPTSTYVPPTTSTTPTTSSTSTSTTSTSTPAPTTSSSTTVSSTSTAATSSGTDYASVGVYHHNVHRANHSAPDVAWDEDLVASAAIVAATCLFEHQMDVNGGGYGQNLAAAGGSGDITGKSTSESLSESISNMWYNGEINSFPVSSYGSATPGGDFESWGHFTQVVWKATTKVGCATQYCASGTIFDGMASWYTVCNYASAGNVGGEYGTNVGAPLGEATVSG